MALTVHYLLYGSTILLPEVSTYVLMCSFTRLFSKQALSLSSTFIDFFVRALEYRRVVEGKRDPYSTSNTESVDFVEGETIQAFLSLTLKLALDDFKPIFYRVFNPNSDVSDRAALTTSYHVAQSAAARLKSLFEFVCESLVQRTTTVLDHYCKAAKESGEEVDENLFEFALGALSEVFAHNRLDGLLTKSYEEHVDALLSVFEAAAGQPEVLQALTDCLSRLASGTQDDAQWKYLNYQVLLCLRSPRVEVRRRVLATVAGFVEARGETYLAVLPDAAPFLCEVMEDEEEDLEAECRRLLKRMEEVFGQSIEGYFE